VKYVLAVIFLLLISSVAFAQTSTGWTFVANSAGSGTDWVNPDSIYANDNERTTNAGTGTQDLHCEMGGNNFSVPGGSTIDSIIVRAEGHGNASQGSRREVAAQLTKDGSAGVGESVGNNQFPLTTDGSVEMRGLIDVPLWGSAWSSTEVNAATFGVFLTKETNKADQIEIDGVEIIVWYSEAGEVGATRRRQMLIRNR